MPDVRTFHLGDVISAAFGVLVSPRHMDGVYDTLNFLTGDHLFTHQLPRAGRAVQPWVLEQHPQLAPIEDATAHCTTENWRDWLDEQVALYGETLELTPMPTGAWLHIHPLEEPILDGKDVIVVEVKR